MSQLKIIIAILLALMILILVVQNTGIVTVRLLFWKFEMSRVLLILLAAVAGFLCGYVLAKFTGAPRRHDHHEG